MTKDEVAEMLVELLKDNEKFLEVRSLVQEQVIVTLPTRESFRLVVERR